MHRHIGPSLGMALAVTVAVAVPTSADPAIVERGGACGLPAVTAGGDLVGGPVGTISNAVRNDDGAKVTCQGESSNATGRTAHFSGFGCLVSPLDGSDYVVTFDSHATVTKKGKATLTCRTALPGT